MRLATIRTPTGTAAVRIDGALAVETGHDDLVELLQAERWTSVAAGADGPTHDATALAYAPVVPHPGKVICVGVNYGAHIKEMGREPPAYPTLFAKYAEALIGAHDDITMPAASDCLDWEAELAVVVGATVRNADETAAAAAIAGYTILNDVTARDWQYRTMQWLQGKTFEATTPVGPHLVTADEAGDDLVLTCSIDGETVQEARTSDLVFGPAATIAYVSTILTLRPGDLIALGTPGGVGHARTPPRYLKPGEELVTSIEGLGELRNTCVSERRVAATAG
jgi:acylpyruvate hydrolase